MAAFERAKSGIPQMDIALDNIRLGDNVVWRISDLSEFRLFMEPYIRQALEDKRNIIYIRFASHPPLIEEQEGIHTYRVELSHRFETFTVEIHNIIEQEGYDAFYVFDCLSELQTAWATDLMMGNFFQVTCPFLFTLDTIAFFPLLRARHSERAVAKIINTTQLFLDVYSDEDHIYVRPEKVWNRESETMLFPHLYDPSDGTFRPLTDGVEVSHFYKVMNDRQGTGETQTSDAWDRFFNRMRLLMDNGQDVSEACHQMCRIMMSRDTQMRTLINEHFLPEDYFHIRDRMVGTGLIGGKACGMLLARKIIENRYPELYAKLEPHDSFYIGSDVFYTYIVENRFWDMRIRQRKEEEYFTLAGEFAEKLKNGVFAPDMEDQFLRLLDYYGQDPYIVRSSSILEDGFGNAFAGKYESVFCANTGTRSERLAEFENAVRTVYASTMSLSALDYRKQRGLDKRDEQMSLLVQRVSGSHYEKYFMPCAAGVGYSYSPYRFLEKLDPSAGMLRLVMGLGTSAVDRTEGSYPRLVSLDHPEAVSFASSAEKHKFSQRGVDVINKETRRVEQNFPDMISDVLPDYLKKLLMEHDYDTERMLRNRGINRNVLFVSCGGLVKRTDLMQMLQKIMHCIQNEYNHPIDIEFTINFSRDGDYVVNLLQCRPLQIFQDTGKGNIPDQLDETSVFLECRSASMGLSVSQKLDGIVYVDPVAYYKMPYNEKGKIARAIGAVNWYFKGTDRNLMLMVPGRIGTTSQELGVPTAFSDISGFCAVCEIAESRAGYRPELSYGSHIFQDLVEAKILYNAVFENKKTICFHPEKLSNYTNSLTEIIPGAEDLTSIIGVYLFDEDLCHLYHDMRQERFLCTLK